MSAPLPVYDPTTPAIAQNDDWSCSPTTTRWMLTALGRNPSEQWIESTMIAEGVANPSVGCTDKSGAGLADFVTRHYGYATGHDGYEATFDELAAVAGQRPYGISGGAWYHWSGLRGYANGLLQLANPAPGWKGVNQTMSRQQFASLGPWSYFWIEARLAGAPSAPEWALPNPDVGSGILAMMDEDKTAPASHSTFLPLGRAPAYVEQAIGLNGTVYSWHLPTGRSWRHRPS